MKKLITSGCSFSECISTHIDTWPRHLARLMPQYEHISKAMSSQGNGLISRGIIYEVSEQLKTNSAEDIIVGIVWSGPSRHDFYLENTDHPKAFRKNQDGWIENPTSVVPGIRKWVILNHHWTISHAKEWYKYFHSHTGQYIATLENILRTQWFLEKHNIKYFMSTFTAEVLPKNLIDDLSTKHLYEQIEFTKFLPIVGVAEWCEKNTGLPLSTDGFHPSTEQHKLFTDKIIMEALHES